MKAGTIKKLSVLLASSYSFRDEKYYNQLKIDFIELGDLGFDIHLTFAWSHFKITLAKCGDDYYQFEGSMNYSENNMAEQILFENNKQTYDYDYKFITGIVQQTDNAALEVIC